MKRMGWVMAVGLSLSAFGAAPPARKSAAELFQGVKRLSVVGTALYVAAHPDDENTRLLSYLVNDQLLRAAYLSFTRGEGGQNLIGAEQGPLLGLIRTQELLAARRVDGAEQYFTRARDFGYSKSVDETLQRWDHDAVLADAVWVIRTLKPDVLITRFPLEAGETHGHHTASARLAVEAFKAAADPAFHPEQVAQVGTWQAKRILWNGWSRDPGENVPEPSFTLNAGGFNPVLGRSYSEIAAESRSMHKSQGFGAAPGYGLPPESFALLAGAPGRSLLDGVDTTWARVPGASKVAALFAKAAAEFKLDAPHLSVPTLLSGLEALRALPASVWRDKKLEELQELIADCAGLVVQANAAEPSTSPGAPLKVTALLVSRTATPLALRSLQLTGAAPVEKATALEKDKPLSLELAVKVPQDAPLANPYWLDAPPQPGAWGSNPPELVGRPERPAPLQAEVVLESSGRAFTLRRAVAYKWTDPTAGERFRDVEVLPAVLVDPAAGLLMFPGKEGKELRVTVRAPAAPASGTLRAVAPEGWRVEPASLPFSLAKAGAEQELRLRLTPAAPLKGGSATQVLRLVAEAGGQEHSRGLTRIQYPHLPIQTLLPSAEVKLVRVELARGGKRLGYVAGAGDDVAEALRQVGYEVTLLSDEALRKQSLAGYDAIVVGVRAYNANPRMASYHPRLLEYVAGGGTLLVQYNTLAFGPAGAPPMGPYPFELSHDRVTDETAPPSLEPPSHRVFTTPNKLLPADFDGWVQERGLYFAQKWDPKYETPLALHDPGEPPSKGSLLIAKHGKGTYLYTGLAFFRQLPAGVPGAYRLFANLLAHAR